MTKINLIELEEKYKSSSTVDERINLDKEYCLYLEEQIEKNPRNILALIHLGVLLWEPFHTTEKAIEYLKKAIQYDSKNVDARFWRAKCYYHDYCDYDMAKQLLFEALEINPNRSDCLSLLATIIEDANKDLDEAIKYLLKAIQYASDWPALRFFLGSLYVETKKIELAEQQIQRIQEVVELPIKKPKNGIENYYEIIVTGRNNKKNMEKLKNLKGGIQEAKDNLSKN